MYKIVLVDLVSQYKRIEQEINQAILGVLNHGRFINGPEVSQFSENLARYLDVNYVVPVANGTEAILVALKGLGIQPGDEVIVPAFTYIATAEVIAFLGAIPVLVDVDLDSFNIDVGQIESVITSKTKAIIPVHLYGQAANMQQIMEIARKYNLAVIEDNAQSLGAEYIFSDGHRQRTGTIGDIGTTSFFPTKNLGGYGDGGAIFTNNEDLYVKMRMIANHGQNKKYYHKYVGLNSRLDTIQAAILNVKLKYIDEYISKRQQAAKMYNERLADIEHISIPIVLNDRTHVFHQYTITLKSDNRDALKQYLADRGIPTQIYYPLPIHKQEAYQQIAKTPVSLENSEYLSHHVLSLPMHTELTEEIIDYITEAIRSFFKK